MLQAKNNREDGGRGVFFALHLYRLPSTPAFYSSLRETVELLRQSGYHTQLGFAWKDPYIQKARNYLVKQFLNSDCDTLFFVADDLEWPAKMALEFIGMSDNIVAGVYPQKNIPLRYPVGVNKGVHGIPLTRPDGCVSAARVQTGFLRIKRVVFENIIEGYPELSFYGKKNGKPINISHDFFPQGVRNHSWIGEDYAFCDLWTGLGGKIWVVPDIDLIHHSEDKGYKGNYHQYLMSLPGGANYKEK